MRAAGERRRFRRRGEAFQALVVGEGRKIGRHRDRLTARTQTVAAIIEAHDLFDALDAGIEHAIITLRERLGVVPAVAGQWLAVGAEDRRHFGLGDAGRAAAAIDDAAAQPGTLVVTLRKWAPSGSMASAEMPPNA